MDKALIIIKSPGIGDLQILLSNIHHLSKEIGKPVPDRSKARHHRHANARIHDLQPGTYTGGSHRRI